MKSHTVYRTFQTAKRRELIRITEDVQSAVDEAGVDEGMALVAAMHITAAVWINDDEPGLHEDVLEWLDKIAPPSWKEPANDVASELLITARGRGSGAETELRFWTASWLADGKIARRQVFWSRGEALEAVGLTPPAP